MVSKISNNKRLIHTLKFVLAMSILLLLFSHNGIAKDFGIGNADIAQAGIYQAAVDYVVIDKQAAIVDIGSPYQKKAVLFKERPTVYIIANPTTIDHGKVSAITVTVRNASGGATLNNAAVTMTATGGNLQPSSGNTNWNGIFTSDFSSSAAGTFTVTASATYADYGIYSGSNNIQIIVSNNPPEAYFSPVPASGDVPLTVTLDASGSKDIDGTITNYSWTFGDGENAEGKIVTHTYQKAGEFIPSLTVKDNLGLSNTYTYSQKIFVNAPAAPPTAAPPTSAPQTTGSIRITSSPSGAKIYLDSVYKGNTPKTIDYVSAGDHLIELTLDDYKNWAQSITVDAGRTLPVAALLSPGASIGFSPGPSQTTSPSPTKTTSVPTPTSTSSQTPIVTAQTPEGTPSTGISDGGFPWYSIIIFFLILAILASIYLIRRNRNTEQDEDLAKIEEWKKEGYDVSELDRSLKGKK